MEISGVVNIESEPVQVDVNGEKLYLTVGVDQNGEQKCFAISKRELEKLRNRGSNIKLAQFFKIVVPGLVLSEHIFEGLKRPLCDGTDMNADKTKLAFTWKPAWDYWWNEAYRFDDRQLEFREAPIGKVFVVNASPNKDKTHYPAVDYWIERWYWVRESSTLLKAPTDWENRYEKPLKKL
jgi:hypothetical protein